MTSTGEFDPVPDRGPAEFGRAWVGVLLHPIRFFASGIDPEDRASALAFAVGVVLVERILRFVFLPETLPLSGSGMLPAVAGVVAVVLLVGPVLYLLGGVATLLLTPVASDPGSVDEAAQALAYATAPCVFASIPILELRAAAVVYGIFLAVIGIGVVHRTGILQAAIAAAVPAWVVYVHGFRGSESVVALLRQWYII